MHTLLCLALGLTGPALVAGSGALYALFVDPKSTLPRGCWRRLV